MTPELPDYADLFGGLTAILSHLNDPVHTPWHADAFRLATDVIRRETAKFEKMAKVAAVTNEKLRPRLEKFGAKADRADVDALDAVAAAFRDLGDALAKRCAEPAPGPGRPYGGMPLHLIGRAVTPSDGESWH